VVLFLWLIAIMPYIKHPLWDHQIGAGRSGLHATAFWELLWVGLSDLSLTTPQICGAYRLCLPRRCVSGSGGAEHRVRRRTFRCAVASP
jgi:hypothetical protein